MPEQTSVSSATSDSAVTTQAIVPMTREMDAEAAASPTGPSNISTISSERLNVVQLTSAAAAQPLSTAGVPTPLTTMLPPAACGKPSRDSSWLELDVCRDFQKDGQCVRSEQCRFAHPDLNVVNIRDGKVTCCYDFLKASLPYT